MITPGMLLDLHGLPRQGLSKPLKTATEWYAYICVPMAFAPHPSMPGMMVNRISQARIIEMFLDELIHYGGTDEQIREMASFNAFNLESTADWDAWHSVIARGFEDIEPADITNGVS
jgi:hypothetical protein